jgi:hypothetical protein
MPQRRDTEMCHPDRSEPTPFLRVRFLANVWARVVEGPWLDLSHAQPTVTKIAGTFLAHSK